MYWKVCGPLLRSSGGEVTDDVLRVDRSFGSTGLVATVALTLLVLSVVPLALTTVTVLPADAPGTSKYPLTKQAICWPAWRFSGPSDVPLPPVTLKITAPEPTSTH